MKDEILRLIDMKKLKVGIFGLGYVGMPLLLQFASKGFEVIGFDIDESKISNLKKGNTMMKHIPNSLLENALKSAKVNFTSDYTQSSKCDALIICVPTPLNKNKEPDLSYVINTVEGFSKYLRKGQVISLESTTYPGTTEEEIVSRVESRDFTVGDDIFVLYSPEREDPGNKKFNTHNIPKVCGGHTKNCSEVGKLLYGEILNDVVMVSTTKVAEMTKLLENIHRAVNIGLANEIKVICDKMDIDVYEVIDAAATKPFGFTPFYPGPGLGGHCIPIDPFYLTWKAREYGMHTRFIELSGEINESMPAFVISKLNDALNSQKKSLNGSKVLILGISYKKNIGDTRESPSVSIMSKLKATGAKVDYSDPYVKKFPKMKNYHFNLSSIELDSISISSYDAVILATDHDDFDYSLILKHSNLLIDCRGKYRKESKKVFQA